MIGTWEIEVMERNRATGALLKTLRAVNTFTLGGELIELGGRGPSCLTSPGMGTWRHVGGRQFVAILRFIRYEQDGSVAELHKITRHLELSEDGREFTGTASVELLDTDRGLVLAQCATESARRFE